MNLLILIRNDVIGHVRVQRCFHQRLAGLHIGDKTHQRPSIIGFRISFALHQTVLFEISSGVEEAIRGDEIHLGVGIPTLQQDLEKTRRRGLTYSDRTGHRDDERYVRGRIA